jgi:type IV secretory pathway VirB10-like protein
VSMDREPDIRPGRDNDSDRAASMRLRAEWPRVMRLSRKVLAGGAAIGLIAISGAVLWALQNSRTRGPASGELYSTDHHDVADGLAGLPSDYAGVTRQVTPLGPALPGDLGRPILNAQNEPLAAIPA